MEPGFLGQSLAEGFGEVGHLVKGNSKSLVDPALKLSCPIARLAQGRY